LATSDSIDPVPPSAYPQLQPVTTPAPVMPAAWTATVLLHPFSPPLSSDPKPNNPFFQLCVAQVRYLAGTFLDVQITGCEYGTWWFYIDPRGTRLSTDQGKTWRDVDMGWALPAAGWFGKQTPAASCAGASPLNWMGGPQVDWWKAPVPSVKPGAPPAATWMWFDSESGAPVRMMFGQGPPSIGQGDPAQLAVFQMFSFTYFPVFEVSDGPLEKPNAWSSPAFPGFQVGNPNKYENFEWNANFGATTFMTPVNEKFDPLPTRVLYVWKPDAEYEAYTDRAQHTKMLYEYNPGGVAAEVALLTGRAPTKPGPAGSDEGFIIDYSVEPGTPPKCGPIPYPQEPPDWVSVPSVEGTIQATITDNPVVAPGNVVTVFSVLFPPALPNYPVSTYLWTWYSPLDPSGVSSRPVTFMQSQSGVGVGTSLALADYFYYEEFAEPIDPANFEIPSVCPSSLAG